MVGGNLKSRSEIIRTEGGKRENGKTGSWRNAESGKKEAVSGDPRIKRQFTKERKRQTGRTPASATETNRRQGGTEGRGGRN